MMPGERAALEGVLAMVKPSVSIEIGSHRGASLQLISAHSDSVHAFDLVHHEDLSQERFPNVRFHIGDSHELLPKLLEHLSTEGTNVDFVFVDGDHTASGVRRDVEDLLSAECVEKTTILVHDTLNWSVRAGLEEIDYGALDKVHFVDLDFVTGKVMREGPSMGELWSGLGLIVTGWDLGPESHWPEAYSAADAYTAFGDVLAGEDPTLRPGHVQLLKLQRQLTDSLNLVRGMEDSLSWRVTAPLRSGRDALRRAAALFRPSR
ncbi:MAG: class I SAM-dependent methyltransferase [Gaiellaceae bacterium]